MDPLSAVLGGVSIGTSVFNSVMGNAWNKRNIRYQQEENAKNRSFNATQAALQRQYGLDVMHEQQRYNSASSQVQRLMDAGLNPALAYGSLGDGSAASPSATPASSSGSISPSAYVPIDPLSASQATLNYAKAQESEQDVKNKRFEGSILETEASFRPALLSGQLSMQYSTIDLNGSQKALNNQQEKVAFQQTRLYEQSCENMVKVNQKLEAEIQGLKQDNVSKMWDNLVKEHTFESTVRRIQSEASISEQEAKLYIVATMARVYNLDAQSRASLAHAANLDADTVNKAYTGEHILPLQKGSLVISNDHAQLNFDSDAKFRDIERGIQVGRTVTDGVCNIGNTIMNIINPLKSAGMASSSNYSYTVSR